MGSGYKFPMPERVKAIVDEVVAQYVADGAQLTVADVLGTRGASPAPEARFEIWWRIRQLQTRWKRPYSYPLIGTWFDRDHTSVLYGVRRHEGAPPNTSVRHRNRIAKLKAVA